MKVVATYLKPEEAHLARSVLEGSGITAYVRDEFTVTANFFYSALIGGVRLEVADEDQARACDVLKTPPPPAADQPLLAVSASVAQTTSQPLSLST